MLKLIVMENLWLKRGVLNGVGSSGKCCTELSVRPSVRSPNLIAIVVPPRTVKRGVRSSKEREVERSAFLVEEEESLCAVTADTTFMCGGGRAY